ncbi:carbon-nitrogen family hydrolase [Salinithrix halophila]|uniref:Carbon-nitrogen family hydrolase n=1 Tax=Salinithrix halophila TaxID=1485204 RepID=A0ABV8JIV2_9BACL
MRISLIQMNVSFGQPEENWQRVKERVAQTMAESRPDVVALPEMWNTAYDLPRFESIADRGDLRRKLAELAREHGITLMAGSIGEQDDTGCYNASYIFASDGSELARYRKLHLFRLMGEEKVLKPGGDGRVLFPVGEGRGGVIICYDLRFPEMVRSLALDGAQCLFVPAQWPHPRLNHWRVLNQARAIENQMVVVAVNRVGSDPNNTFCGHSMVIDPWGNILAEAAEGEEILTVDLDLSEVEQVRRKIPVFEDRIPGQYRN